MPKPIALPPLERLHELFEVVPIAESQFGVQSGLVWKAGRGGKKAGSVAGYKKLSNRTPGRFDWRVGIDGRRYTASRVLYLMANGVDPGDFEVDHKDQNPLNNNVGNLRLGDDSLQGHNQGIRIDNKSGAVGVSNAENGKWKARLWHEGELFYLGRHTCLLEAARTYNTKVIELGLDKIGKPLNDLESISCECFGCCSDS